ncbi:MAG: hypothetical protein IJ955_10380 [Oscillospiraceae bacterium]|nr:hypothetical protein [Oscillospiraceae bacterium]
MIFKATLGNANHPNYGVASIPFPIPKDQYENCMEMLNLLEIGDPHKRDCAVHHL